jgi:hypothetical protein
VAEVLHAAYAEGKLDLDEHTERTTAALNARTFDELAALTSDLVPAPPTALTPVRTPAVYDGDEPDRVTAMLAESNRTGPWPVRRVTQANVFLGSVTLDLTEATFPAREIEVNCTQLLGQITIRVPLGTTVGSRRRTCSATPRSSTSVSPITPCRSWSSRAPTSSARSRSVALRSRRSGDAT